MVRKNKISACFTILIFSIVFGCKVSALSGSTYIDKAYLEGVYTCWTGHLKSAPITQNDFPVFSINFPNRIFKDNNDGAVLIPRVLSGLDDNDLGCVNLMAGQGSNFSGLVSMSGVTQPANDSAPSTKTTFMENIGYSTEKTTSSTGKCASFNFKANSGNRETRSGSLCLTDLTNDEKITNSTKVEIPKDSGGGNFTLQDSISFKPVDGGVEVSYGVYTQNCTQTNIGSTCSGYVYSKVSKTFKVADYRTFDDFMSGADGIAGQFNKQPPSLCAGYYQLACIDYALDITKSDSIYNSSTIDESMVQYVVEDKTVAANTAIKTFSGSEELKDWASLKYTDAEKAHLYQDYLNKVFEVSFADDSCPSLSDSQIALLKDSGYSPVKWNFSGSGAKVCYIKASEKTANKEVVGIKEDGHFGEKMKFSDLITALESITLTDGESDDVADSNSDNGKVEPTCMNSGGAASLGWIVCPILDWMQEAATNTYNNYVKPNLMVQPTLFQGEGDETRAAWTIFQGFANICFIILFLVVIFSQLTGYGIDNYGIKKLLPKMIIVAVLVNLSYLICVLCVDLSNILGNAFQSLFEGLSVGGSATIGNKTFNGSGEGATVITAVALVSALFLVGRAVWENPAILLTLLVSALGVLIAIFFLFVLLAGRKAAIVVLMVISPLAFVSYMLPNLKRQFFDKWFKFWEGLLLVYPICGLLIGGGDFVSRLLLVTLSEGDGFLGAFTAMIVGIIPVFMIPAVLKGAFAAMGNIGSKITGFGDRVRSGAAKNIRNSDSYKNLQKRGLETGIRRKAGYDRNGDPKKLNGFQRFIRGGRRNVQRNALAYQKLRAEKGALEATEGKDFMLEVETANEAKRIVANGEANRIGAVGTANSLTDSLYRALISEDRAKIRAYTDSLSAKGEDGRAAVRSAYDKALSAGMSGDAAATFADNIMAKHAADYKNNNRSMFEVAKDINLGNQAQSTTAYTSSPLNRAHLADSVTATTIGNMDDGSFEETFGGYHGKTVDIPMGANRIEVGRAAYDALHDQNANIKGKRREYLQEIVNKSGYRPPVQKVKVIT